MLGDTSDQIVILTVTTDILLGRSFHTYAHTDIVSPQYVSMYVSMCCTNTKLPYFSLRGEWNTKIDSINRVIQAYNSC